MVVVALGNKLGPAACVVAASVFWLGPPNGLEGCCPEELVSLGPVGLPNRLPDAAGVEVEVVAFAEAGCEAGALVPNEGSVNAGLGADELSPVEDARPCFIAPSDVVPAPVDV